MPTTPLLPLPDGMDITSISKVPEGLLVRITSERPSSPCPICATVSSDVHSYYRRQPADLPCAGQPIRLYISVRKFFCRVADCPRKIFTERLPELIQPSSRLTTRLRTALQQIGFESCGKAGERLAASLGLPLSDTTLLSSLHQMPLPPAKEVRVVGIDDWAWRRGMRYGTIIVDLERHKVIDVLADRSAESVKKWLQAHPKVEVVSRDRGGTYADGSAQGAPLAQQVADRWHLCKNLGDAVEKYLLNARICMPPSSSPEPTAAVSPCTVPPEPRTPTKTEQETQKRLERKQDRYDQVHQLHQQGMSIHRIAEEVNVARNTVRRYLHMEDGLVVAQRPRKASILDPYYDYILTRWQDGCHNGELIFREIRERGYKGSVTHVRAMTTRLRQSLPAMIHPPKHAKKGENTYSPRELRWLLAKKSKDLSSEEQEDLSRLLASSEEVRLVHSLVQRFLRMLRLRQHEHLRGWLDEATASEIKEIQSFVAGIERDYDAVAAGFRLHWSQGQVEGNVNRLKTLKRQMYGRAGFELLRQRVLHRA